ncbi:hypothetical protein [Flexibacterium corallicola]|uniref:hypothetical protein n=1 Tax=Flexibacterium corallicola TaxID=3037259 RepID=UPI00286F4BDB|nr:hypothetical protein [Pseudovibrio sp. M1P-2-3]
MMAKYTDEQIQELFTEAAKAECALLGYCEENEITTDVIGSSMGRSLFCSAFTSSKQCEEYMRLQGQMRTAQEAYYQALAVNRKAKLRAETEALKKAA